MTRETYVQVCQRTLYIWSYLDLQEESRTWRWNVYGLSLEIPQR